MKEIKNNVLLTETESKMVEVLQGRINDKSITNEEVQILIDLMFKLENNLVKYLSEMYEYYEDVRVYNDKLREAISSV